MDKFNFAVDLVKKAKEEILQKKDNFTYREKTSHTDLVTDVDIYIEDFISQAIVEKYPNDSILGEEQDTYYDSQAKADWILDPIDGTMNFIQLGKDFAISLAYYENNKPKFGIVLNVVNDNIFTGIVGQGAYYNDEKMDLVEEKPIKKSLVLTNPRGVIDGQLSPYLEMLNSCRNFRYYGVASLEICYVALGLAEIYISRHLLPWDYAAAIIIAREVGLKAFNFEGDELTGYEEGPVVITTNKLYQTIFIN